MLQVIEDDELWDPNILLREVISGWVFLVTPICNCSNAD